MKLNKKLLNLIIMLQDYKRFSISRNIAYGGSIDWYGNTKAFYYDIPDVHFEEAGIKQNRYNFDKMLDYVVTEEIKSAYPNNLDSFTF